MTPGSTDVQIVTDWPGLAGHAGRYQEKVPSQIAYKAENQNLALQNDVWGYEIPPRARRHYWTKLLLDKVEGATSFDDPLLTDSPKWTGLSIPKDKPPQDVIADFLSHLYRHCMQSLERHMGERFVKRTPIEFWLTMPAFWSHKAQFAMVEAAKSAGFGESLQREYDTINVIREPEAAVLSVRDSVARFDQLLEVS